MRKHPRGLKLKGKVLWLLMTARIHLLSPDIRRDGRVGDLIIPVLDPKGKDRKAFVTWMLPFERSKWAKALFDPGLFNNKTDADVEQMYVEIEAYKDEIEKLLGENVSAARFATLKSYIESMQLSMDEIPAAIEDHIPPDIGKMYSDSTRINQILINLLTNANKFTQNGILKLVVEKEEVDDRQWIYFKVNDTGIGIPENLHEAIFEPFNQADNSYTRIFGGTGLGLTITKAYCNLLQGNITVESELPISLAAERYWQL